MNLNIFIHGNITGINNAMMKITGSINVNIPMLTQPTPTNHKHCFLHVAYECPYDRQSSRTSFTATATSYIRVTLFHPLMKDIPVTPFSRLLDPMSRLLHHTSGLPKILPWLHLTLLMTLGLWGAPSEQPRQGNTPRTTPTYSYYSGGCMYICCSFTTTRWGVTRFYQNLGYVLAVLNLSIPKIITFMGTPTSS